MISVFILTKLLLMISVHSRRLSLFDSSVGEEDFDIPFEDDFVIDIELDKRGDTLRPNLPTNLQKQLSIDMRSPLNALDFRRAKLLTVEDYQPMDNTSSFLNDPIYFEGDINEVVDDRNAIRNPRQRWPSGRVPYVISDKYNEQSRAVIAQAVQDYEEKTCVRFVPRAPKDNNYIYIYPSSGCSSEVGLKGGMQVVSIGEGCTYVGIVEHELMHAIGFWHEQSRADRDLYVRINWQNIQPGMAYNFEKKSKKEIQHLNQSYDYKSLMHYGAYAFAKSSQPTIVPLKPGAEIGQRYGLSKIDLFKINKLYECVDYLKPIKHKN